MTDSRSPDDRSAWQFVESSDHPDGAELELYAVGALDAAREETLAAHVRACALCDATVAALVNAYEEVADEATAPRIVPFEPRRTANPQTENSPAGRSRWRGWAPWLATAATVTIAAGAVVQLAREREQNAALRAQLETSSRQATFLLLGSRPETRGLGGPLPSVRLGDPTLLLLQTGTNDAGEFAVEINESGVQRFRTVVPTSQAMVLQRDAGLLLVVRVPAEALRAGTEYEVTWRRGQAGDVGRAFFLVGQP